MTPHKAIREALEAYQHKLNNGRTDAYAFAVAFGDLDPAGCIESLLDDLDAKTDSLKARADRIDRLGELVERETAARQEAQRQLYEARERHTAEVKKLQAEIGRLQALRREPMTEKEMEEGRERIFSVNNPYCPCDQKTFSKVARYVEAHHHITQKEQG